MGEPFYSSFQVVDITPTPDNSEMRIALRSPEAPRALPSSEEHLTARALAFKDQTGTLALILAVDILWVGNLFADRLRDTLAQQIPGLARSAILICASHSHASIDIRTPEEGLSPPMIGDQRYAGFLQNTLHTLALSAVATLVETTLSFGAQHGSGAIGRRLRLLDVNWKRLRCRWDVRTTPHNGDPRQEPINVLRCQTANNHHDLVNFAAHPILSMRGDHYSPDYCGYLDGPLGTQNYAFLQGYTGDLLPNWYERVPGLRNRLRGRNFRTRQCASAADLQRYTETLVAPTTFTPIAAPHISSAETVIALPLQKQAGTVDLRVGRLTIGPVEFYWGAGEMLSGYARWLRLTRPQAVCVGYTNGMAGYIPSMREILEGGYEPVRSISVFGWGAPLKPEADGLVRSAFLRLFQS